MILKIAKRICKLQGIKMKVEVKVICPGCNRKTLIMNLTDNKAYCIRCHKVYKSLEEVLKLMEEEYLEDHKAIHMMMRDNKGVEQ